MSTAITDHDRERFKQQGFLVVEQLIDFETVQQLRAAYDDILEGRVDCGLDDRKLGGLTRQVMFPSKYHPVFQDNAALRNARQLVAELLRIPNPRRVYSDMLISKEPGQKAITPWHQDFAYAEMPATPPGRVIPYDYTLQFWVALDPVDVQNGCMQFVPGVHLEPLKAHRVVSGDPQHPSRLLAIENPERVMDLSSVVACPLAPGGATIHSYGTPHFTAGNTTTDRPRRAYIFNYGPPAH